MNLWSIQAVTCLEECQTTEEETVVCEDAFPAYQVNDYEVPFYYLFCIFFYIRKFIDWYQEMGLISWYEKPRFFIFNFFISKIHIWYKNRFLGIKTDFLI